MPAKPKKPIPAREPIADHEAAFEQFDEGLLNTLEVHRARLVNLGISIFGFDEQQDGYAITHYGFLQEIVAEHSDEEATKMREACSRLVAKTDPKMLRVLFYLSMARFTADFAAHAFNKGELNECIDMLSVSNMAYGICMAEDAHRGKKSLQTQAAAKKRHAHHDELKAKAIAMWEQTVDPKVSAELAAEMLRNKGVPLAHGTLARLISKKKRALS